ncbi:hypothetical protein EUTSA_v10000445mg, partial [Eutrema salsugineum]
NRKRHEHTLHYFPRRFVLVCDVCGLEDNNDSLYVCLLCDFIVHKHVASHSSSHFYPTLPNKELTDCGVCHAKIEEKYEEYSCIKGCTYAVHSKCAMRRDVCDGKEYEGEPEEVYENMKMFEEEGNGIIRHLSRPLHQMRLDKNIQRVYGETKYSQACRLPFHVDDNVYQCIQCDFFLHEPCAHLPRVKQFMLHLHPLTLQCSPECGFKYVYGIKRCDWKMDTLCASISEPFDHHSHPHHLFLTSEQYLAKHCSICPLITRDPLACNKCNIFVCFHCATLTHKTRYEHDEHLLTFSYERDIDDEGYWCEICEEGINRKRGLYDMHAMNVELHSIWNVC